MSDDPWDDWADVATLVCGHVFDGAPVLWVAGGGGNLTAFCGDPAHQTGLESFDDYKMVRASHIIGRDPSTAVMIDMPERLCAGRTAPEAPWVFAEAPDTDDDTIGDDALWGLSRAEIRELLDEMPEDAVFYRAENEDAAGSSTISPPSSGPSPFGRGRIWPKPTSPPSRLTTGSSPWHPPRSAPSSAISRRACDTSISSPAGSMSGR